MAETFREDEWVVEKGLAERTGLVTRQIKEYRTARWIEGGILNVIRPTARAGAMPQSGTTIQKSID
nr:excisionase family protein [Klebsiella pneumoniae]